MDVTTGNPFRRVHLLDVTKPKNSHWTLRVGKVQSCHAAHVRSSVPVGGYLHSKVWASENRIFNADWTICTFKLQQQYTHTHARAKKVNTPPETTFIFTHSRLDTNSVMTWWYSSCQYLKQITASPSQALTFRHRNFLLNFSTSCI